MNKLKELSRVKRKPSEEPITASLHFGLGSMQQFSFNVLSQDKTAVEHLLSDYFLPHTMCL